jgi:CheY-like chemotaxis protein
MDRQPLLFLSIANRAYGGDPTVLDMLRVLFKRNQLNVRIESVPENAIVEMSKQRKPTLILAGYRQIDPDDSMPLVGEAAIKALKSDPDTRDIPILMLEAIADIDEVARECGVDAYVQLPWGAREIYPAIVELIEYQT